MRKTKRGPKGLGAKKRAAMLIAHTTKAERRAVAALARGRDLSVSTLLRELVQRELSAAGEAA
jgi:hypothetical protein